MPSSPLASLALPQDVVSRVRAKVASGRFADEGEVIAEALAALQARDDATEHWLRSEVVAAWEEHQANPSQGRSLDQVREGLQARHDRAVVSGDA